MLWYGHLFLPPFPTGRHFSEAEDRGKIPSVITFLRDPILRMASGYNYIRVGARTEKVRVSKSRSTRTVNPDTTTFARSSQHRNEILTKLGNKTLSGCAADPECTDTNQLRKQCSMQTMYICGSHEDCVVHWHLVDGSNHVQKTALLLARAKQNLESEVLFVGMVEEMERSNQILSQLLPTYFEDLSEESIQLNRETKSYPLEASFERNFKMSGSVATNVAPKYAKPTAKEREKIIANKICYTDFELYRYAKELLEQRSKVCDVLNAPKNVEL